jgi:phosphate transport system permease protein
MTGRSLAWRRTKDSAVKTLAVAAAFVGLFFLGWILWEVVARGFGALDPGQTGGGLANAIVGTIIITGLAALMGVPVGMLAGVYLAEFGRESRFAPAVRFLANVLMGIPSMVVGVFVYALLVMQHRMWFLSWGGHFSAYAGAVALAIIMLPLVARTTEDMLNLVPNVLRESALALGVPRWRATLGVVFRSAKSGLLTGVLLGIARVSGETAPLLFTALNSPYWMRGISDPTANLTVTIFSYAMSPYSDWKQQAWGASLVITAGVLLMTVAARLILRKRIQWS